MNKILQIKNKFPRNIIQMCGKCDIQYEFNHDILNICKNCKSLVCGLCCGNKKCVNCNVEIINKFCNLCMEKTRSRICCMCDKIIVLCRFGCNNHDKYHYKIEGGKYINNLLCSRCFA